MTKRDVLLQQAATFQRVRNYRGAAMLYAQWLDKAPMGSRSKRVRDVAYSLGVVHAHMGQTMEAMRAFERALQVDAGMWQAALCVGRMYVAHERHSLAMWVWQRALAHVRSQGGPVTGQAVLLNEMARCLMDAEPVRAMRCWEESLTIDRLQTDVLERYLTMRRRLCAWPVVPQWLGELFPGRDMVLHMGPEMVLYEDASRAQRLQVVRHCLDRIQRPALVRDWSQHRRGAKLCIAYVYDEHIESDLGLWLLDQVAAHNRDEVYVYALDNTQGMPDDVARQMLQRVDLHVPIWQLSDEQVAARVRELRVDALINPLGVWESARWGVYAHGAAPLQLAYGYRLGVDGVGGLTHVLSDCLAATDDACLVPRLVVPALHTSRPQSLTIDRRSIRQRLGVDHAVFVYGVASSQEMVGPEVWRLWMQVLRRQPEAVLCLRVDGEAARAALREQAQLLGVNAERLCFVGKPEAGLPDAWLQAADVFLDTWPCSAGLAGLRCLAHCLPMVTCAPNTSAGTPVADCLQALDLDAWVAIDTAAYVQLAVRVAVDPTMLGHATDVLQQAHQSHRLFDEEAAARGLEASLRLALTEVRVSGGSVST